MSPKTDDEREHRHEINCQNCYHNVVISDSLKMRKYKESEYSSALTRCKQNHWVGEKERFVSWRPKQWNDCEFLRKMAEDCQDFELMD